MRGTMQRTHAGFTLIELLIVVAIIGIIAAIAIPALLRARVSANESATISDVRTLHSAQTTYQGVNGGYYEGNLTCMSQKGGCVPGAPPTSPTYLDKVVATQAPKAGYSRQFVPGKTPTDPEVGVSLSAGSKVGYGYLATPMSLGQTGVRGFGGDASGILCFTPDGVAPGLDADANLVLGSCTALK